MPMKIIASAVLSLTISGGVYACITHNEIDDGSVTIKEDEEPGSGIYRITAPSEWKGRFIDHLVLSATNGENDIRLPLAIEKENGVTVSYFYLPKKWLNISVSATYEGNRCSSLVAKLSM